MIVITMGNSTDPFPKMVETFRRNMVRLNYKYFIYDFKEFGDFFQMNRLKPRMLLQALNYFKQDLIYIDADVFIMEPIDEVFEEAFDVGLTYRGSTRRYVNAGVLFLKPTPRAQSFLQIWIDKLPPIETLTQAEKDRSGDQFYLNQILDEELGRRMPLKNLTKEVLGTYVRFFDRLIYNAHSPTKTMKVLHNKGCFPEMAKRYGV